MNKCTTTLWNSQALRGQWAGRHRKSRPVLHLGGLAVREYPHKGQPPKERTAYAKQTYYNPAHLSSDYVKTSGLPLSCQAMSMTARYAAS